ncbi:MAG TPA: FecR domain-containing protein [Puia sp.]|jgi:ferric-dicitrate binding protein FerR (iron transport regulator)|nr:FecR domain-containing protein [Puia sp.]
MEPSFDIEPVVLKYVRDRSLTADEAARLRQWLAQSDDPDRMALIERMRTDPEWVHAQLHRMQQVRTEVIWSKIGLPKSEPRIKTATSIPLPLNSRRRWWSYTAAASVILAVCGGGAWLWHSRQHAAAPVTSPASAVATDVQPGRNKAVLTLADGRQIDLGATANGVLADQGSTKIAKLADGQLTYNKEKNSSDEKPAPLAYNSLSTPRAGQFTLRLPDGSRVWLNNASVLRYPVAFTGRDRTVELAGEAYFEVAKDVTHPFRVIVHKGTAAASLADLSSSAPPVTDNGGTIEVLGTSFNIMAYNDEPAQRTTLVDGSIRVTQASQSALLKPAEQSALDAGGKLHVTPDVNVAEAIAWKNGYFHFDHASLQTTMRQLARWYDIDVVYQGQIPEHEFVGRIQRNLLLSDVLKGLENEQMHFRLEGRKLVVTP